MFTLKLSEAAHDEGPALGPLQDEAGNLTSATLTSSSFFSLSNCSFSALDFRPRFLPAGLSIG